MAGGGPLGERRDHGVARLKGVSKIRHLRMHTGTNRTRLLDLGYISMPQMLM